MASYYYLMASLPMLRAQGEPPIRYSKFLETCRGIVSDKVYKSLEELTVDSEGGSLLHEWAKFYGDVKAELAFQRRVKAGFKAQRPDGTDMSVAAAVTAAVNCPNPLTAEQILLALEFDRLDEMVGSDVFDERALYGYALKLQLSERRYTFDYDAGKEEFSSLLDGLRRKIFGMQA